MKFENNNKEIIKKITNRSLKTNKIRKRIPFYNILNWILKYEHLQG